MIGQIDDFDRFLKTLVIWGCFSQKSKIPKNDCSEKVKIEEKMFVFFKIEQLISNIIYIILIV